MTFKNFDLQFMGFEPKRKVRIFIEEQLKQIHAESPHNSYIRLYYTKLKEGTEGMITVNSQVGRFFAHEFGHDIVALTKRLQKTIRRELKAWKKSRFREIKQNQKFMNHETAS